MAQTSNSSGNANAKFAKLSEEFIHETLALSPSTASQAGYHQHVDPKTGKTIALDALLDDVSAAGMAEQRRVYAQWRERLRTETPLASLGVGDAADWQLIDDQIALSLLELDRIQEYKHNPTVFVEFLGSALFQPLTRLITRVPVNGGACAAPMKRPEARTSRSSTSTTAPWIRAHCQFPGWETFCCGSDMNFSISPKAAFLRLSADN